MPRVLERLAHSIDELASLRPRLREQAEAGLIRLAVAIVRRELTVDPDAITGLVKAALEQLAAHEGVRVRVHPEHEGTVRACLAGAGGAAGTTVVTTNAMLITAGVVAAGAAAAGAKSESTTTHK